VLYTTSVLPPLVSVISRSAVGFTRVLIGCRSGESMAMAYAKASLRSSAECTSRSVTSLAVSAPSEIMRIAARCRERFTNIGRDATRASQAEHAIAWVEESGEGGRNAVVRKLRDGLCLPVFVYLERVTPQVGHQPSLVVAYRRRNTRDPYASPKEAIVAKDLILADDRRAGQEDRKKEIQAEANTHLAILPSNSTGSTCLSAREALRVTRENRRPSAADRSCEISVESAYGCRPLHQSRVVAV